MQPIPAPTVGWDKGRGQNAKQRLVAEASADSNALAANGAATAQHGCASLGLHARAETVSLHAFTAIGLKGTLGHENALLFS